MTGADRAWPKDRLAVSDLLRRQDGVVSRRQLHALGATHADVARMVRRRELTRIGRAVFVEHTGPLTSAQRDWAAVLRVPGSALADESALSAVRRREGSERPSGPVVLAVKSHTRVAGSPDVLVRYVAGLERHVHWNASPPRMRTEVAAIRVAGRASTDEDALAVLTDTISARLTTPSRLRAAMRALPRARRRRWLDSVLEDLCSGACSVLEHGYLTRVERAHSLPPADRQVVRTRPGGQEYRDVEYGAFGVVVELDGRAFHASAAAWDRDHERDLDDHVAGKTAVRLGWGQVFQRSCRTAGKVGAILSRHGWLGTATPCGPECRLGLPAPSPGQLLTR